VVHTWPQICDIGGRNPTVICEDCTRDQNGVEEPLHIWVPLKQDPKPVQKDAEPKPKKVKKLNPFDALLVQEGLL
jgi:hypothetical protein